MGACDTLTMTKVSLEDHSGPWTEDEFLALDKSEYRIELLDGSLWVSPGPNGPHQDISSHLVAAFLPAAKKVGLRVRHDMNLRLKAGMIMIPDLVVSRGPRVVTVTDAGDTVLVCEITSPSNGTTDRELKKRLYATAGIRWYLLVEPDMTDYESASLHLFRLGADGYDTYAVAKNDEVMTLEDPFPISIQASQLLGL